ncbi:SMI1/KNR4 family protein [Streptococcus sp. V913]
MTIELLTIDQIISIIEEAIQGLDPEIREGIVLSHTEVPVSELDRLKKQLQIQDLDPIFRKYILAYNWGQIGFLSYQFGYGDDTSLTWLMNRNLEYHDYSTLQERGLIIIANGDPYTILLDCQSGAVYALDAEMNYDEKIWLTPDFLAFVRAMGTAQSAVWKGCESDFIRLMTRIGHASSLIFWQSLVGFYD